MIVWVETGSLRGALWRVGLAGVVLAAITTILISASPAGAAALNTKITAGPSGLVASRTATFKFKATVVGATFDCKLDRSSWSPCTSPRAYRRLRQGHHVVRVRARRGRTIDPTPARRTFTVDTVKPETTILTGPVGLTEDHSPTYTFEASEPGRFECNLNGATFQPCASPFLPAAPLIDGPYTFRVRARDAAGNVDATPATRVFDAETPLTEDLETAQAAAALYFPDTLDIDIPSSCGGSTSVDCPGGIPSPPGDQLRITSSRAIQPVAGQHRYDVTVTQSVTTLQPVAISYSGANCNVTLTSANGLSQTWTFTVQLNFAVGLYTGKKYISPANPTLTGMENADYSLTGDFICTFAGAFIPASVIVDQYEEWLVSYWICAAPGPAYLGPCAADPNYP